MSFDDLDAPQYSNFEDFDQEGVEQYFKIDHESNTIKEAKQLKECVPKEDSLDVNNYYPINTNSPSSEERSNTLELRNRIVRRSSSCENVKVATENVSKMCLNSDEKERREEHDVRNHTQFNYGSLRKGNSVSQSKIRYCSQESLNRLAIPKKIYSSTSDIALSSNDEYVSMAEAVRKFHEKTPSRFHTRNKNNAAPKNTAHTRLKPTIPMSPHLLTKKRIKVNEAIISHEQKIQMEFEREQNFKIRANPVNKKILQPMKAIHLEKKPPTVPEPFQLTKNEFKKAAPPRKEDYQFRAKIMPKSIKEPPKLPKKLGTKLTEPVTPSFMKKQAKPSSPKKEVEKPTSQVLKATKPEPFSFEKRNQIMMKKKEEKLKKIEEEEKKAREFHARPIPHSIANLMMKQKQKSIDDGCSSPNVSGPKDQCPQQFKARPPKVLHQKPFEPKKVDQPLTEVKPFNFNSEVRAIEREMFENKKKEMEKIAAMLHEEEEQQRTEREEEERKRIREETKFKAQPIRNFKGVIIEPSCKVTEPVSPIFLSGKSNRKNKENEM